MKKFLKIILIFALIVCTGCSSQQGSQSNSLEDTVLSATPAADILDLPVVTADWYTQQLEYAGITVEYKNIVRNDYPYADADMVLTNADGRQLTVNITVNRDQYKEKHNSSSVSAIFPGNVQIYGDEAIITTADRVLLASLDEMELYENELDISMLEDIRGIAITAVKYSGGYAVLYYSPGRDGILLYNEKGQFLKNNVFEMPGLNMESNNRKNWLIADYRDFIPVQQMRYTYMYPAGENSNMLIIHVPEEWPDKLLYDTATNMLYGCQTDEQLITDNSKIYNFYEFDTNTDTDGRTFNSDRIYLVEREENGSRECIMFQFPQIESNMLGFRLSEGENENQVVITHDVSRREITVDFDTKNIDKKFNIPGSLTDYRNGKIRIHDVSPSGRYVLYIFDSFIPGSHTIYEIALLDTYTGKTKFVCENQSQLMGPWGETGFLSDSEIYNFDTDYRIYSTDMNATGHKFRLSEHFPMGHYKDESGDTIINYVFEFARLDNGNYVVVYCHFPYNEGKATDYKYLVSILDSSGNMKATYDTGVYLPDEWLVRCEMYLKIESNIMNIYAYGYGDIDESKLLNGTFNLETGEFVYTAPEN